jgi:hypothetical protein
LLDNLSRSENDSDGSFGSLPVLLDNFCGAVWKTGDREAYKSSLEEIEKALKEDIPLCKKRAKSSLAEVGSIKNSFLSRPGHQMQPATIYEERQGDAVQHALNDPVRQQISSTTGDINV